MAFRSSFFLDGRTETLEEQALLPLLTEDELDRDPEEVIADLAGIAEYVDLFAAAFPDDPRVTVDDFAAALAAFQRTFISKRSLYDCYVGGDVLAFSDEMVEGMFRFAEMGCDDCHAPPLFESETFANRNVPGLRESSTMAAQKRPKTLPTSGNSGRPRCETSSSQNRIFTTAHSANWPRWSSTSSSKAACRTPMRTPG